MNKTAQQNKKPNILLIVSDQHNHRVAGYAGDPVVRTPNIDSLAKEGIVFEKTYCQAPVCTPSRASFLTGKNCSTNHCWTNHWVLFPEHKTIAHYLDNVGYETCLVGKMHFGGADQFHGFKHRPYGDFWHGLGHQPDPIDMFPNQGGVLHAGVSEIPESMQQEYIVTTETSCFIKEHLANSPDKPWFVCASYCKPHAPLVVPSRYFNKYLGKVPSVLLDEEDTAARENLPNYQRESYGLSDVSKEEIDRARAAYWGAVEFLDDCIGMLLWDLDRAGALENTIVIYTSDHGDLIGNHGLWWKANYYEESVRVPFIFKGPGLAKNVRRNQLVGLIDLLPTICDLAGCQIPSDIDGVTLKNLLLPGEIDFIPHKTIISEFIGSASILNKKSENSKVVFKTSDWSLRLICDGRFKFVEVNDGHNLFFDLESDPKEYKNEIDNPDYSGIIKELKMLLNSKHSMEQIMADVEEDKKRAVEYRSHIKPSMPNQYRLKDGRIFDAEEALYGARWLRSLSRGTAGTIPQQYH